MPIGLGNMVVERLIPVWEGVCWLLSIGVGNTEVRRPTPVGTLYVGSC
jgi:hypothetical protein